MKSINKYIAVGLILNFISCDLLMNDELKEKSLGLFDKVHSVLYAKVDSIKDKKTTKKKKKRVIKVKRPSAVASPETIVNGNDVVVVAQQDVKNDVLLDKEATRVALSGTNLGLQNINNRVQETSGNSINRSVQSSSAGVTTITFNNNSRVSTPISRSVFVEPKKDDNIIVQSNLINFDIDFNSHQSQIISGSNLEEIEEDEDYYYFQEGEIIEDDEASYELVNNSEDRRHNAYVEGARYNVGKAIDLLDKMKKDYENLQYHKLIINSTYSSDYGKKAKAKEEASKFTKEKINSELNSLLNYITVSAKTAKNFVSGNAYTYSLLDTNRKQD